VYQAEQGPTPANFFRIPEELRTRAQWVNWRFEERDNKPTKMPYNPRTREKAKSTDSATWSPFVTVVSALEKGTYDGIGFVFSSGDPYTGIDLDHCRNPKTGEIAEWAQYWVKRLDGYVEVSPSGEGLHIIVKGKSPRNGKRTVDGKTVEIYSTERYFTCTGVQP
jgi:putative DNA primase/helicase